MLAPRVLNTITVSLALCLVALAGWHVSHPETFELLVRCRSCLNQSSCGQEGMRGFAGSHARAAVHMADSP